jgi:hypothetical protein
MKVCFRNLAECGAIGLACGNRRMTAAQNIPWARPLHLPNGQATDETTLVEKEFWER